MINFYGVFQLVKVIKETKTKNGDLMIYFTAASNRKEDVSDFKLFKIFGKNAERFINNLEKKGEGYKSRRMMIDGYVETYTEDKTVKCSASIKKEKFPAKYGELIKDFKVEASTVVKVDRDSYVVNHFQFLDKKGDGNVKFIESGENDEELAFYDAEDEEKEEEELMEAVKNKSSSKAFDNSLSKALTEGENRLNSFKNLITG